MLRRTLTGLVGAAVITLALAAPTLAETLPDTDATFASASFSQDVGGARRDWTVHAEREALGGTSGVAASYSSFIDTTCLGGEQDGQPGFRSVFFTGSASVRILIPGSLALAAAGARIRGTETTFDSCTGSEITRSRSHTVALALVATSAAETSSGQKCIDAEQVLDSTFTFRTAAGAAFVDARRVAVQGAVIGHQVSIYRADPACADA